MEGQVLFIVEISPEYGGQMLFIVEISPENVGQVLFIVEISAENGWSSAFYSGNLSRKWRVKCFF
jgi:hypothetical protein